MRLPLLDILMMAPSQQTLSLLLTAAVIRLAVFLLFPAISDFLTNRVEVSTPISSYKRLQEGIFLHQRGLSPYDGGVYHQPPLLLALFETVPSYVLFTCLDVLNGFTLKTIAEKVDFRSSRATKLDGNMIMALYLFNPFTLLSCVGRSTNIVTNAAIVQAIAFGTIGDTGKAIVALGLATYLSLYPALLLPPLLLLCWGGGEKVASSLASFTLRQFFAFLGVFSILYLTTPIILFGSWDFAKASYGVQITVPDLTPNIGLWWYFFIEIFDAFREFFIGVFWLLLVSYVGSLTIRLHEKPLFVLISLLGLFSIFKPYPSISDVSLYLGFLPLYKHVFPCECHLFCCDHD